MCDTLGDVTVSPIHHQHSDDALHKPGGLGAVVAGPALALVCWIVLRLWVPGVPEPAGRVAALVVWMAVWWVGEVLPLGITALLPLLVLPAVGVLDLKSAASPYADRIIFLFAGGFLLALGMERWNLHRRIALFVMSLAGTSPRRLVLGVMAASTILSMWVSNTATALMMLPIALGIIELVEKRFERPAGHFAVALILGVCYAASIGGVATPIGSPPNAVLVSYLDRTFNHSIGFGHWMLAATPFVILFVPAAWVYLVFIACPVRLKELPGGHGFISDERAKLGPVSRAERGVMACFALTVAGWVLRDPVVWVLEAWGRSDAASWIRSSIDDPAIAMAGGLLLFVVPSGAGRRHYLMDWTTAKRMPWDILLLFGGGLCLAAGIQASGLDRVLGDELKHVAKASPLVVVPVLAALCVFVSEFTSNVAQANVFYPILGGVALSAGIDPMLLLFPCCIALSNAFMMPMGTPPNAIAFSTGRMSMKRMALTGMGLNVVAIIVLMVVTFVWMPAVLGLKLEGMPSWATRAAGGSP